MAFDRGNPADLLALKTEVNTDPIGMGYAAQLNNTAQLLKLLNDPANNVGGDTSDRVFDSLSLLDALEPGDLEAQQTNAHAAAYTQILVAQFNLGDGIEAYKAKWRSMFQANSATVIALDAQVRLLSRAEVLFDAPTFTDFTVISREDWAAARDS